MTRNATLALTLSALCALSLCFSAKGASLAFFPNGADVITGSTTSQEVGTRFRVTQPLQVLGFAYFDADSDGFASTHSVNLWTEAGALIASATIGSNSPIAGGAIVGGHFRSSPADFILVPGEYRLSGNFGALARQDQILIDEDTSAGLDPPVTVAGVEYIGRALAPDGAPEGTFPSVNARTVVLVRDDWFGANLVVAPVPEPSAGVLLLLSGILCTLTRKR